MNGSASGAAGGEDEELPAPHELGEELKFTGRYKLGLLGTFSWSLLTFLLTAYLLVKFDRFGGGLWLDIKRKVPWYCSDIYDGFHIQSISAVLFIYLGCITNAITFGGLLGDATDNYQVFKLTNSGCFVSSKVWLFVHALEGSDGELPGNSTGGDCLLPVWWAASHHPQFDWTHSHLRETTLWV